MLLSLLLTADKMTPQTKTQLSTSDTTIAATKIFLILTLLRASHIHISTITYAHEHNTLGIDKKTFEKTNHALECLLPLKSSMLHIVLLIS